MSSNTQIIMRQVDALEKKYDKLKWDKITATLTRFIQKRGAAIKEVQPKIEGFYFGNGSWTYKGSIVCESLDTGEESIDNRNRLSGVIDGIDSLLFDSLSPLRASERDAIIAAIQPRKGQILYDTFEDRAYKEFKSPYNRELYEVLYALEYITGSYHVNVDLISLEVKEAIHG